MITTPHAHQKQAFEQFLALGHGAIFADMGTGKGLIALMLADAWAGNVLVLCPKSVLSVWEREPDKHYPGRWLVCVPRGPVPRRVEALRASLAPQLSIDHCSSLPTTKRYSAQACSPHSRPQPGAPSCSTSRTASKHPLAAHRASSRNSPTAAPTASYSQARPCRTVRWTYTPSSAP